MRRKISGSNYIEFKIAKSEDISAKVKKSLAGVNSPDITVDLSSMNMFDAAKVAVLTSVYHSGKFPTGKIKCKTSKAAGYNFINPFITKNLEFI